MKTTLASTALFVMLAAALPRAQQAAVHIAFNGGRVTLTATDALVSDVLAEWARVGGTLITGTDRLPPAKVTIALVDADEPKAIEALIGSAAGYASKLHTTAPAESSIVSRLAIFSRAATAAPAPARVIDMSIPESKYLYPSPVVDDLDLPAVEQPVHRQPPTPDPAAPPEPIPELRYRYADPASEAPGEPDAKPQDDKAKKPEAKVTKQPPSSR